jgi:hypothetical protein
MEKEIQKLSGELQSPGAADRVRGLWDKAAGLFRREPGQAQQTTNPAPQKEKDAVKSSS